MNTNQNSTCKCNILQINIGSNSLSLGFFKLFDEIFRICQVLQWFPGCFIVVLPFDKILHPSFPESFLNYFLHFVFPIIFFLLFLLCFQLTRNLLFLSVFLKRTIIMKNSQKQSIWCMTKCDANLLPFLKILDKILNISQIFQRLPGSFIVMFPLYKIFSSSLPESFFQDFLNFILNFNFCVFLNI